MNPPEPSIPPEPTAQLTLEAISEPSPNIVTRETADNAAKERQWLENRRLESELEDLNQDRKERRKYAHRIFCLVVGWLTAMILIVIGTGISRPVFRPYVGFDLAQPVVITLITTTTVSVVGIFLIVASYLFPKRSSGD